MPALTRSRRRSRGGVSCPEETERDRRDKGRARVAVAAWAEKAGAVAAQAGPALEWEEDAAGADVEGHCRKMPALTRSRGRRRGGVSCPEETERDLPEWVR